MFAGGGGGGIQLLHDIWLLCQTVSVVACSEGAVSAFRNVPSSITNVWSIVMYPEYIGLTKFGEGTSISWNRMSARSF